jgi:hypothetical protein
VQPQAQYPRSKLEDIIAAARPHLTKGEFKELEELLTEYEVIFAWVNEYYGRNNKVYHRIDTGDVRPIRKPPRRIHLAMQEKLNGKHDNMQRRAVIYELYSPWASPALLVKKNGGLRFCVNCRKLNGVTKKDYFPLPRIDDTLDTLAGAKGFPTVI